MAINNTGFKIEDWTKNRKIIWINSNNIDECMKVYYQEGIDIIGISPFIGYKLPDINFLKEYRDIIKGLRITSVVNVDISIINSLRKLKYLSISGFKFEIDLNVFKELEALVLDWNKDVIIPRSSDYLKEFYLGNYNSRLKNLEELPDYPNLEELELSVSPVTSLKGISKFQKLKSASFGYLTKLEDICDISSPLLEMLIFENCKKIRNHETVAKLKNLKILRFNICGEMKTINFIRELPHLEDFRFVDTNVLDGDMTPCFGLKSVGYLMKKHYSHTLKEVENIIKTKS